MSHQANHKKPTATCPKCRVPDCNRVRRRGLDYILARIGYYPFRCPSCDQRFRARPFVPEVKAVPKQSQPE